MAALLGPHDAHDRLFKYVFGAPAAMAVLLRRMLPSELLVHLDLGSLQPAPTERTSSRLGGHSGDLHFTVGSVDSIEGGARSKLHLAVEHRSTPDPRAPLRFMVRAVDLWHDHLKSHPNASATASLPVVLPLLLTQQPARTTPTQLSMILDVPPSVRERFQPPIEVNVLTDDFSGSVLDDPVADPVILARVELARAFLHAYRNPGSLTEARMKTLAPLFDVLLDQDEPLASNDINALLTYIVRVFDDDSPARKAIEHAILEKRGVREMYTTIAESWFRDGERRGQARAVIGVLEHRNLAVPEAVRERVLATRDEPRLQQWFHRAFSVTTAEQIFDSTNT